MPIKIVVDASAIAAVLFGEPEAPKIAERLGDSALVAPTLFSYEIANICWKKLRRHPEKRAAQTSAHSFGGCTDRYRGVPARPGDLPSW